MTISIKQTSVPAPVYTLDLDKLASMVKVDKKEVEAVHVPATLHKLVVADLKAVQGVFKAQGAEYKTMHAIIAAMPLEQDMFKALCDDIKTTFGEVFKESAQLRVNMLNNARAIAVGKKVEGKWIQGTGLESALDVVESVSSLRMLKKALSEAKPEAMKGNSGGARTAPAKAAPKAKQVAPVVTLAADKKTALQAAMAILKHVEQFLQAGTDADTINAIEECIEALELAA